MLKKSSFVLIVPCYNEQQAIPDFSRELVDFKNIFSDEIKDVELQVLFVNNNSTDSSPEMLAALAKQQNFIEIINCPVQGYGAALKAGFKNGTGDWYGFADLDNTYPLGNFIEMVKLVKSNDIDIVYANRLRKQVGMPWLRQVGNNFYSVLAQILFKNSLHDMCSGMRVFSKNVKSKVLSIPADGLNFSIEFTAISLKQHWRRAEIDIIYRERIGVSKLNVLFDGFAFLIALLKVRFRS